MRGMIKKIIKCFVIVVWVYVFVFAASNSWAESETIKYQKCHWKAEDKIYCDTVSNCNKLSGYDSAIVGYYESLEDCVGLPVTGSSTITPTEGKDAGSKPSSAKTPKKTSTSAKPAAPKSGATTPKPAIFGAPTNLGNPKGTPKTGGSVFLPECATDEGQGPGHGCRDVGAFVSLFVNYANASLAFIGAVAFLFFIYGGVMLLISGGEAERVKKGRDAIVGAVIGIIIVFGAQLLVRFVIQGLVPAANLDTNRPLEVQLPDTTKKK